MRENKLIYNCASNKAQKLGLSLLIAILILGFSPCFNQAQAQNKLERIAARKAARIAARSGKPIDASKIGQKAANRITTQIKARQATKKGSNPKNFSGFRGKHQLSSGTIVVPIGKEGETGHVAFNGQAFKINVHNGEVQIRNSKGEVQDLKGLGWYAMVDTEDGLMVFSQTPIEEAIAMDNNRIAKTKDWFLDNDIFSDVDEVDELAVESDPQKVDKLSEAEQFAVLEKLVGKLTNNVVSNTVSYFKDLGQAFSQGSGLNGLKNLADDFIAGLSDLEYLKTKLEADIRLARLGDRTNGQVDSGVVSLQPPVDQGVMPGVTGLERLDSLSRRDLGLQNLGVTSPTWVRLARFERFQKAADLMPAIKPNFIDLRRGLAEELDPALAKISQTPQTFKNLADNSKLSSNSNPKFKVEIRPSLIGLSRVSGKVTPTKPISVSANINPKLIKLSSLSSVKQVDSELNSRLEKLADVSARTFNAAPNLKIQDISFRPEIRPSFQRLSEVSSGMARKPLEKKELASEINFRFKQLAELTRIAPASLNSRYFSQEKTTSSSLELARITEARKVLARASSRKTVPKLGLVRFIQVSKDSRRQTMKTLELVGIDVQNVLLLGDNYLHHPIPYYFSSESKYINTQAEEGLASFLLHSNIIKRQLIIHNLGSLYD